jgi:hypothetical protein
VKNSIASQNSHNKVLILGAICISIIAGVVSYKIADIKNQQKINKRVDAFDVRSNNFDETTSKILDALDNSDQLIDPEDPEDPFTITDKDTATSRMAKQVYYDYVNQEAGNSDLTVSDIATNALSQISSNDIPKAKYNLNNISYVSSLSNQEIRLYGNNFAEIYIRNLTSVAKNQAKYSDNLTALAGVYENISKELIKIKVPTQISSSHLAIINNYQIMADSFRLIDTQSQDPVKSLLGVKSAKEASEDNDLMFINIGKYFKNSGIIFGNNEVGSIWNAN